MYLTIVDGDPPVASDAVGSEATATSALSSGATSAEVSAPTRFDEGRKPRRPTFVAVAIDPVKATAPTARAVMNARLRSIRKTVRDRSF